MFSVAAKHASQDTTGELRRCVFCHQRRMRIIPGDFKNPKRNLHSAFNQTVFLRQILLSHRVLRAAQMITPTWLCYYISVLGNWAWCGSDWVTFVVEGCKQRWVADQERFSNQWSLLNGCLSGSLLRVCTSLQRFRQMNKFPLFVQRLSLISSM